MNNIDPKILELAKRDYGENCELVKRTEWSYSFKCGPKSYCSISRFMAEKGFGVSASEMRQRWPSMNERERMDFASNFHVKEAWTENDTETLEIIMNEGNDHIWSCCALAMLRHPDRNRAVEFLIDRVERSDSEHPPLNYMQALGIAGDRRAVAAIRPYYDKYLKAMEGEAVTGVPDNVFWGPIPYHAFLSIAGDLYKIEGSGEYEQSVRKYFDHPNEQVRWWAEHALGVEGPTTAKRNAEDRKKRSTSDIPSPAQ
jgi:hypothetical protein